MIPSLELIRSLAVEIVVATPNRHEDAEPDARCDLHIIEINQARAMPGFVRRTSGACERAWLLGGGAHRGAGKYGVAPARRDDPCARCHLCRNGAQLQHWGGDCGSCIRRDRW